MSPSSSSSEMVLSTAGNRTGYRPYETLELTAQWALPYAPSSLEARLFWFTRGKGTSDTGIVATEPLPATATGEQVLRFKLPAEPYSFSGKLISLVWAVELVAEPAEDATRFEFTLGPEGREILLHGNAPS